MPLEIAPGFAPYKHQYQAFTRLHTTDGHQPKPTLLTTGKTISVDKVIIKNFKSFQKQLPGIAKTAGLNYKN